MNASRMIGGLVAIAAISITTACGSTPPPPAPPPSPTAQPAPSVAAIPSGATSSPDALPQLPVRRVPPGQEDAFFARALARRNVTVTDDPNAAPVYGRVICAHVRANEPSDQLLNEIQGSAHLSLDDAGFVLGAAAAVYCPEEMSKLPQQ